MALTFLDTILQQYSLDLDADTPVMAGDVPLASHAVCTNKACLHDRDEFYAEIIRSLNECIVEGGCCSGTAASLVEDEPLAHREWKRLLERVLSGPMHA